MTQDLMFIKLGGSLITDKRRESTVRAGTLRLLAEELRQALTEKPDLRLLLGHGSGSFGHWEASRYNTRAGVHFPTEWHGFSQVSAAASRLNRIVVDAFMRADVPVLSLQPSASVAAEDGRIASLALAPIQRALEVGIIPLIFGDVAFDSVRGGTILSTEDLFFYLAPILRPRRILLLGNAPGVLDDQRQVISLITPRTYPEVEPFLRGAGGVDVTGGMADKVARMVALVADVPGLEVRIFSGRDPENFKRILLEPEAAIGTRICADAD
ncbi:MAG: isopentenyl phosphate kinase [Anaerolineae bacterium]|jgi:isopentenyl phosphate kinase|nr:isopentenyl phosphate kinase [Anaerolineae bacterium]